MLISGNDFRQVKKMKTVYIGSRGKWLWLGRRDDCVYCYMSIFPLIWFFCLPVRDLQNSNNKNKRESYLP